MTKPLTTGRRPHLLLVKPAMGGRRSPACMEPLALAILASLTPSEVEVTVVDERLEEIPFSLKPDGVALSVCTFSARRAYEIAGHYRQRGIPVVLGGFHPTLCPQEGLLHADAVVLGDAEHTWPRVVTDLLAGTLQPLYRPLQAGPAPGTRPNRTVFLGKKYLPLHLLQFSRGCPRSCEFCSIRAFYGGAMSFRPVAEVLAELQSLPGRRVFFVDDNFLARPARVGPLLEAMIPMGLSWSSQADISFADDPAFLELVARSGCQSLAIGFESLHEDCLRQMGKGCNSLPLLRRRLDRIRRAGIMVFGTFVFGYDQDRPESIMKTLRFALDEKLFLANFNPLQALPGTPLYHRLRSQGRLAHHDWWLHPDYRWQQATVRPLGMGEEELTAGCAAARCRFHSLAGILRRLADRYANAKNIDNIKTFLAANLVSRLDIRSKTGASLWSQDLLKTGK